MAPLFALLLLAPAMADESVMGIEPVAVRVDDDVCVDRAGLVALVELRAGVGSVIDEGPRVVSVRFSGRAPEVGLTLTLVEDGGVAGTRRLGPFADCGAAVDAAALAIALVIDPFGAPRPRPTPSAPSPSPPSSLSPSPPPSPSPPTLVVRAPPVDSPFRVGVAAGVGVGSGLGVVAGPMGLVRLHFDPGALPLVIAVGGRVDVPGPLALDGVRSIESVGAAFFVEGCGRLGSRSGLLLDLCGLGQAGGVRAVGLGFARPAPVTARIIGVGGSLVVRVPLWSGFGAFARAGVDVPVLRARLVDDAVVHWESPPLAGQLTVGLDGLAGAP